jgi:cysteinyl-tRNA synthetase
MANFWMHNGFLQVEGEKMSKSLGNFVTIHELLETGKFGNSTWPGDVLRLAMLRTDYRQPIDWTVRELERALEDLRKWYELASFEGVSEGTADEGVIAALCDDLNTHSAIVRLHELAGNGDSAALRASLRFLGFSCDRLKLARRVSVTVNIAGTSTVTAAGSVAVSTSASNSSTSDTRGKPKITRHFVLDAQPASFSVAPGTAIMTVERGDGTFETDPSTQKIIDDRIARRNAARAARNFAEADKLRDELGSMGIVLKDNKDGTTTWEIKR